MANKKGSGWTIGEDTILVKTMKNAKNRPAGYRKSARLLGRTASACMNRYAKERYKVITESVGKATPILLKSVGIDPDDLPNVGAKIIEKIEPTIVVVKPKNGKIIAEMQEELKELSSNLTERIADLHEVKGGMQSRHAYCYYRDYVWRLQGLVNKIK